MVAFATQVKRRRGTTAQNDEFTGAEGEIVVDTEKHTLRVHDGETQGGFEMARQSDVDDKADTTYVDTQLALKANTDLSNIPSNYDYVIETQEPTSANGYTWYRKYKSGWVEQGGYTSGNIGSGDNGSITITLPVAMSNANYTLTTGTGCSNVSGMHGKDYITSKSATSFVFTYSSLSGQFRVNKFSWQASGMSAQ